MADNTAKEIAHLEVGASKLRNIADIKSQLAWSMDTIMKYESKDDEGKDPHAYVPSEKDYEVAKEKTKMLKNQLKLMDSPGAGFTFGK